MTEEVIRYYEGDVTNTQDPLLSDSKAYVTWNALLFPDIKTEIARNQEHRTLNPSFLQSIQTVEQLTKQLLDCMQQSEDTYHVYRVERLVDYQMFLKEGRLLSFISTSTKGFLTNYQDKHDLVLMDITIPKGTFCIDFSKQLEKYSKSDEEEILLPPYLTFTHTNLPMTKQILSIKDGNNHSPAIYCKIDIKQQLYKITNPIDITDEMIQASKRVYTSLNQQLQPNIEDVQQYLSFKQAFQNRIQLYMHNTL